MRVLFAGSGEFGLPTLTALGAAGHEIVAIYTQPDRPSGRGRKLNPTPVGQYALDHNLPLIRTSDFNAENLPPADVMVVIAFGQKIAPPAVIHPRFGSINLHASVLPKYRGAAPINWAILRGEKSTGNSVIRLSQRMDAGAVLAQSQIPIGETETAGELHDRLAADGAPLIIRTLDDLQSGTAREVPQEETQATVAPKLKREDARLDWNLPAEELARKIRGLYPWPGCRFRLLDAAGSDIGVLTLVRAAVVPGEGSRWCGGEIQMGGEICVKDGDAALRILEVQPQGKRPMPMDDYRRGHAWQAGMKLESITSG